MAEGIAKLFVINPVLKLDDFDGAIGLPRSEKMTLEGTISSSLLLLGCVIVGATFAWDEYFRYGVEKVYPMLWIGTIGSLAAIIATAKKPAWAPFTSMIYAVLEGIAIGAVSASIEHVIPGAVMQAVALTFGAFTGMLVLHRWRLVKVNEWFISIVVGIGAGIGTMYVFGTAADLLYDRPSEFLHIAGWKSCLFSVITLGVAVATFLINLNLIEAGLAKGAPRHMESLAALAIIVSMVWVYLEALRYSAILLAPK